MTDEHVETPLHRACTDMNPYSTFEDIQRLIDEDPQALVKRDGMGNTPLHLACFHRNQSPDILQVLLDRSPVQVHRIQDNDGFIPLHWACSRLVSIDIMRQMIRLYPKALRMLDKDGYTPLYCASQWVSLEVSELLILHCPEACLILNKYSHSPYDGSVLRRIVNLDVVALLQATTINALIAFLVCVNQTLLTVPPAVIAHIRQAIPGLFEEGSTVTYMNSNEAIREALRNHETLKTLLQNDELQTLLKEEDCQDLVRRMYRMVQAGRFHADREDSKHHVWILESVVGTPDFMYLHLRSNPTLCDRSTVCFAHQQVSTTTEQDTEASAVNDATQTQTDRDDDSARPTRKRKAPDYLRY
jgi:ankyrin repeat protein